MERRERTRGEGSGSLSGHREGVCPSWVGEEGDGAEGRRFASVRKDRQPLPEISLFRLSAPCWRHSCFAASIRALDTVRYPMCTWRARAEAESEMRETERLLTEVSFEMSAVIGVFSAEGERNSGFGIHEQRDIGEL